MFLKLGFDYYYVYFVFMCAGGLLEKMRSAVSSARSRRPGAEAAEFDVFAGCVPV